MEESARLYPPVFSSILMDFEDVSSVEMDKSLSSVNMALALEGYM